MIMPKKLVIIIFPLIVTSLYFWFFSLAVPVGKEAVADLDNDSLSEQ